MPSPSALAERPAPDPVAILSGQLPPRQDPAPSPALQAAQVWHQHIFGHTDGPRLVVAKGLAGIPEKEFTRELLTLPYFPGDNLTALHVAAGQGQLRLVPARLLTADLLALHGRDDLTPLHLAARFGHLDQIHPGLLTPAAMTRVCRPGDNSPQGRKTPLDAAVENDHLDQVPLGTIEAVIVAKWGEGDRVWRECALSQLDDRAHAALQARFAAQQDKQALQTAVKPPVVEDTPAQAPQLGASRPSAPGD